MTHIDGIGRVVVPVTDQDRALEFYLGDAGDGKARGGTRGWRRPGWASRQAGTVTAA